MERFREKVEGSGSDGCWRWNGGADAQGRPLFSSIGGLKIRADRFAYELDVGKLELGEALAHTCGNEWCVNPTHLVAARPEAIPGRDGRYRRGSKSANAKLTEDTVRSLRARVAAGESYVALAAEFGVSQVTISRAVNGRDWKQVE